MIGKGCFQLHTTSLAKTVSSLAMPVALLPGTSLAETKHTNPGTLWASDASTELRKGEISVISHFLCKRLWDSNAFRPDSLTFGYATWISRETLTESLTHETKIIWDPYENVNPDFETDHQPASLDCDIHIFPKTYLNLVKLAHVLKILWWRAGVSDAVPPVS